MKPLLYLPIISLCAVGCAVSTTAQLGEVGVTKMTSDTALTVFLLERDIPQQINRLGTVTIPLVVNTLTLRRLDTDVKKKLSELGKKAGANGAYRISEGTYSPYVVSYLLFHYDK